VLPALDEERDEEQGPGTGNYSSLYLSRQHGDTNFMPIVADTKVISQSLDALYDLLVSQTARLPDCQLPAGT
jgi:hypothetical protein